MLPMLEYGEWDIRSVRDPTTQIYVTIVGVGATKIIACREPEKCLDCREYGHRTSGQECQSHKP